MALANPPTRNRGPVQVSVSKDAWDEAHMEIASLRNDITRFCDAVEPRLRRLVPVTYELGPDAYQLVAGSLRQTEGLRARARR